MTIPFDADAMLFIQEQVRNGFLTPIMKAMSFLGDAGMLWIAIGIIMLFFPRFRRSGIFMLTCLALATLVNNLVIKELVARPRPYTDIAELTVLIKPLDSFSFPSGHSCSSFASATALALTVKKRGALAFIPAALIAFSRVYVGVHYPSDVLVGAAVGALVSIVLYLLLKKRYFSDPAQGRK